MDHIAEARKVGRAWRVVSVKNGTLLSNPIPKPRAEAQAAAINRKFRDAVRKVERDIVEDALDREGRSA